MCREHAEEEACGDAVLLASELVVHSLTIGTRPTTLSIDCQVSRLEISLGASGHGSKTLVPTPGSGHS